MDYKSTLAISSSLCLAQNHILIRTNHSNRNINFCTKNQQSISAQSTQYVTNSLSFSSHPSLISVCLLSFNAVCVCSSNEWIYKAGIVSIFAQNNFSLTRNYCVKIKINTRKREDNAYHIFLGTVFSVWFYYYILSLHIRFLSVDEMCMTLCVCVCVCVCNVNKMVWVYKAHFKNLTWAHLQFDWISCQLHVT